MICDVLDLSLLLWKRTYVSFLYFRDTAAAASESICDFMCLGICRYVKFSRLCRWFKLKLMEVLCEIIRREKVKNQNIHFKIYENIIEEFGVSKQHEPPVIWK
jgi:hypothetical protein